MPFAYVVAAALTAINFAGLVYAAVMGEAWHALVHVFLVVVCGRWARTLRERAEGPAGSPDRIELLEDEVSQLRGELFEAQERLEFAERMMVSQVERQQMRHDP
jgi:hypothetical protein